MAIRALARCGILPLVAAMGCGASVVVTDAGGVGGGATTAVGGSSAAGLSEEFCAVACATSAEGSCLTSSSCAERCAEGAAAWTPKVGDAFASCVVNSPLCFETLENCMFRTLHDAAAPFPLRVEGTGLVEYEGKPVYVWSDPGRPPVVKGKASITDGAFAVELPPSPAFGLEMLGQGGGITSQLLLLLYVDVDADSSCKASIDVTESAYPSWNGNYLEPAFTLTLAAPLKDASFVCASLP